VSGGLLVYAIIHGVRAFCEVYARARLKDPSLPAGTRAALEYMAACTPPRLPQSKAEREAEAKRARRKMTAAKARRARAQAKVDARRGARKRHRRKGWAKAKRSKPKRRRDREGPKGGGARR